ncbi:MAG TPA: hypothetical protein GXX72_08975, partial [Clostridiaceae bacterium]|nr:hypothetical protein [Clostridiaceae bacterium]
MALTTSQEQELLAMNEAFKAGKAITDLDLATSQDLKTSYIEVVQDGVSKRATPEMLAAALPVDGIYPDIPVNRVTIKRYSGQLSPLFVYEDNTSLMAKILALCKPVLLNRDSLVDTYLSGSNCLKSA